MCKTRKFNAGPFLWIAAVISIFMAAGTHARLFAASGAGNAGQYLFALFKGGLITGKAVHFLMGFSLFSLATLFVSLLHFDLDYRNRSDYVMGIPALLATFSSLSLALAIPFSGATQFLEGGDSGASEIAIAVKIAIPALAALGAMFYPAVTLSILARGRGLTAKTGPAAESTPNPVPATPVSTVDASPMNLPRPAKSSNLPPDSGHESIDRSIKFTIIEKHDPAESGPEFTALLFDADPEIAIAAAEKLLNAKPVESFVTVLEILCKKTEIALYLTEPMDNALKRVLEISRVRVEPVTVLPADRGTILERWVFPYLRGIGSIKGAQWILKEAGRFNIEAAELSLELAGQAETLVKSGDFIGALSVGSQFGTNEHRLREIAASVLESADPDDSLEKLMPAIAALASSANFFKLIAEFLLGRYPGDSMRALESGPSLGMGTDTRETLAEALMVSYAGAAARDAGTSHEKGVALLTQALALIGEGFDLSGEVSSTLVKAIEALRESSIPVLDKTMNGKHPVTLRGIVAKTVSAMGGQQARNFIERHRL